jgi:hypothetical protein
MVNEFIHLAKIIRKMNTKHNILKDHEIEELIHNTTNFIQEKNHLLNCIRKLSFIDQKRIQKIIATKIPDKAGPISHILCYTNIYLMDYEWQFYRIRDFLYPFVKYYKHKAQCNKCVKESIKTNPIKNHYRTNYTSGIVEIEDLIALLDTHNNYLGEDKVLSEKEINHGYQLSNELSAINCDIQHLLQKIEQTDLNDICTMDILLRMLYGKILVCAEYIRSLIDHVTGKIAKYYPDWDHVVDGVPYT